MLCYRQAISSPCLMKWHEVFRRPKWPMRPKVTIRYDTNFLLISKSKKTSTNPQARYKEWGLSRYRHRDPIWLRVRGVSHAMNYHLGYSMRDKKVYLLKKHLTGQWKSTQRGGISWNRWYAIRVSRKKGRVYDWCNRFQVLIYA